MKIIAYRPQDDQFWIACSKDEAEKWFIPLLDDDGLRHLYDWFRFYSDVKEDSDNGKRYDEMVMQTMEVNEIAYAYFNVSRDLSVCYADVAHHPFHQLWNGYSPFDRCDHVDIIEPKELIDIVMTYQGVLFEKNSNGMR